MDCKDYRRLYPEFSKLPLPREIWDTPEHEEHTEHFHDCASCGDWTLAQRVEARGARVEDHPCVHIAYRVSDKLESSSKDPFEDPDVIIWQFEDSGEYGIPVRDGGSSIITIDYCPWCGVPLHKRTENDAQRKG